MKKILFLLLCCSVIKIFAQDKKLNTLFENRDYCKCIERYDKLASDEKNATDLFLRTASFYQLHLRPDAQCEIKDPFNKAVKSFARLQKAKGGPEVKDFNKLKTEILNTGIKQYNQLITEKKLPKALQLIEALKEIEPKANFLMAQAFCENEQLNPSGISNARFAITSFSNLKDNADIADFTLHLNNLLFKLDSIQDKGFRLIADSALFILNGNELTASIIFSNWKKEMLRFKNQKDYDNLFKTINTFWSKYPEKPTFTEETAQIVLAPADSMAKEYASDNIKINFLLACCNYLTKAREKLPEALVAKLSSAQYYKLPASNKSMALNYSTHAFGLKNSIKFENPASRTIHEITFGHLIPKSEILSMTNFFWNDAPRVKRARLATEQVKKETFNPYLLDSLCHVYLNKFRTDNNRSTLKWNKEMYRASKQHASTMACVGTAFHKEENNPVFGHPDSIKVYQELTNGCSGENVQLNIFPNVKNTYKELADKIIQQWANSPEHKKNMLDNQYVSCAVSCAIVSDYPQGQYISDNTLASKYYPEIKKLFEVIPSLKAALPAPKYVCFSVQNFSCK